MMNLDIILAFKAHQPFRIRKEINQEARGFFDRYFDQELDKSIFRRVCDRCYLPVTDIILRAIDEYSSEKRKFKVTLSISGTLLDQCEMWNKDLLEKFKQLAETGCVEFLSSTYYHSLACMISKEEFVEQIELHQRAIIDLLGYHPRTFENTELIFNNHIARIAEELGFKGIIAEGAERILGWRSPNYVYEVKGCDKIKVLTRNYRLSDDIAFRFSARWWDKWPLTADKYASWLDMSLGQYVLIFLDVESIGEHHDPSSGIYDFLRWLPFEVLKNERLCFSTPSEVVDKHEPVGEIDVPEYLTSSWSGTRRDISAWLSNIMQQAYFDSLKQCEEVVKRTTSSEALRVFRYFAESDHLHSMYSSEGSSYEVHAYLSPFYSPEQAFSICQNALSDFKRRLEEMLSSS